MSMQGLAVDPDPLLPATNLPMHSSQDKEKEDPRSEAGRTQRMNGRAVKRTPRHTASLSALAMVMAMAFAGSIGPAHGMVPSLLLCGPDRISRHPATRLACSAVQGGGGGDANPPPAKPAKPLSIVKNGMVTPHFDKPEDIPPFLMEALKLNDFPEMNSGLRAAWDLGGDTTRFIFM